MARDSYRVALERTGILRLMQPFDPRVAGTPPLGLDMEASAWDAQARLQEAIKAKQRGKSYAP